MNCANIRMYGATIKIINAKCIVYGPKGILGLGPIIVEISRSHSDTL